MLLRQCISSFHVRCFSSLSTTSKVTQKLAFVSDIHLEKRQTIPKIQSLTTSSPIHGLALLGDIGNPFDPNYFRFLYNCSNQFEHVYLLAGNHEYYHSQKKIGHIRNLKPMVTDQIHQVVNNINYIIGNQNICFLDNDVAQLPNNNVLLGSTLWSHYNVFSKGKGKTPKYLVDFNQFVNKEHFTSKKWLKKTLENNKNDRNNIVVMTHYIPTFQLVHSDFHDSLRPSFIEYDDQNRFYTNLEHLMGPPIHKWICGHSHRNMKVEINQTKLEINAQHKVDELPISYVDL